MKQILFGVFFLLFLGVGMYLARPSVAELEKCYSKFSKDYCNVTMFR